MSLRLFRWRLGLWILVAAPLLPGCGGDSNPQDGDATIDAAEAEDGSGEVPDEGGEPGETRDDAPDVEEVDDDGGAPEIADGDGDADTDDVPPPRVVSCSDEPPPGADLPDPLPIYGGECPTLVPGRNTILSTGAAREFLLVVPTALDPSESLPLIFLWHWLGGEAADSMEKGEVQAAADDARFLAVAPEAKGDLLLKWPYSIVDLPARVDEEARFFDDMLACVAAQYPVNRSCVSSVGVSAGALWTSQLAPRRAGLIASFLSLSGGVGQAGDWINPIMPWFGSTRAMPAVVLWGGPTDFCGVTFSVTSHYLENALDAEGHFYVECIHNCSHAEPPLVPPAGESKYSMLWQFMFDHPFWLRAGESPYQVTGLPANFPEWCGIGGDSATIREGACEGGLLGSCM
jgi:hypothetical protein